MVGSLAYTRPELDLLSNAFPLVIVAVFCNLSLLSAMAAGRAESGSAGWALGLFVSS